MAGQKVRDGAVLAVMHGCGRDLGAVHFEQLRHGRGQDAGRGRLLLAVIGSLQALPPLRQPATWPEDRWPAGGAAPPMPPTPGRQQRSSGTSGDQAADPVVALRARVSGTLPMPPGCISGYEPGLIPAVAVGGHRRPGLDQVPAAPLQPAVGRPSAQRHPSRAGPYDAHIASSWLAAMAASHEARSGGYAAGPPKYW